MFQPVRIGSIVRYYPRNLPAIVTEVHTQNCVSLSVFDSLASGGAFPARSVPFCGEFPRPHDIQVDQPYATWPPEHEEDEPAAPDELDATEVAPE